MADRNRPTRELSMEECALANGGETITPLPIDLQNLLCHGLTKREYFAALALQGIMANPGITHLVRHDANEITMAETSVRIADRLLLALERVKP